MAQKVTTTSANIVQGGKQEHGMAFVYGRYLVGVSKQVYHHDRARRERTKHEMGL